MISPKTPISREHVPGRWGYIVPTLVHVGLTHWEDLDGRCECALAAVLPRAAVPALTEFARTHGATIVTHEGHTVLRSLRESAGNDAATTLVAALSRADCPVLYGLGGGESVPVPRTLVSNWGQVEAYWWREGVDAAFKAARDFS